MARFRDAVAVAGTPRRFDDPFGRAQDLTRAYFGFAVALDRADPMRRAGDDARARLIQRPPC